ncbi:hypothetical protein QIA05_06480 (plasmid) [Borreliella burgdorferi]|uniref:hypothetical protein n=1 Tax=Borreliella burgdorferi TaxID=139 RepID=UPI00017F3BA8|nr:hypothetical protein [Borreliella burgdorferi]ACN24144.1 conserved hypothetical protein [Borreliella burgdorferi 64b]
MINKKNLYYFIFALFSLNANEFMGGLLNGDNNDTGSCLIRIVKIDLWSIDINKTIVNVNN